MNIFIKNKLGSNTYETDSSLWHVWLDVAESTDWGKKGTTLNSLVLKYDKTPDYYKTYLPVLEIDGIIKLENHEV